MPSPSSASSREQAKPAEATEIVASEPRNLLALAAHMTLLRTAWIFKTESVLIPAFLDSIAGAGWLRGLLPVLSRVGQSIPPLLYAERLRAKGQKKWALLATTLGMAAPFCLLSLLWFVLKPQQRHWLPPVFLLLYFAFFCVTGINQLAFSTLQGKLIRAERRGRLMGMGGIVGSICAITCAGFLLNQWLSRDDGFGFIFGFTGLFMAIAAVTSLFLIEPRDPPNPLVNLRGRQGLAKTVAAKFHGAWLIYRNDLAFRRLAAAAMLFSCSMLLFPHYQALARIRLGSGGFDLMLWVVVQNAAVGLLSVVVGMLADRRGNRLALRLLTFAVAATPLVALAVTQPGIPAARELYCLTFVLLGLTPVTMRTLLNYTLELAPANDHPQYVGTLSLCLAIPFLLSPLVGLLVDIAGFSAVFCFASLVTAGAGLQTFRLTEPRHAAVSAPVAPPLE